MIHEHENDFINEITSFVQAHPGQVGVYMIIRLPGGEFVHQMQEARDRDFYNNQGRFDQSCFELMQQLIAVARRGPGGGGIILPHLES